MNLGVLGDLDELGESRSVVHSQIGQHLAVEVDVGLLQTADELGVGHAVHAGSRVDTGNPQGTEITGFSPQAWAWRKSCADSSC